jgi:hypothetical protein
MSTIDTKEDLVDDEPTRPIPVDDEIAGADTPHRPWASGDFRASQTTIAFQRTWLVEFRLTSEAGDAVHFALDNELAPAIGRELERGLLDYSRHHRVPTFPLLPPVAALEDSGTDVFFRADNRPVIRVSAPPDDDRISLRLHDETTYLRVSMQVTVAMALRDCLLTVNAREG